MMIPGVIIRAATSADAAAVTAIYAPEVLTGTASFETEAPTIAEMAARMGRVAAAGWPWLIAEADGDTLGYAYAAQFRDRAAYAQTCENSVYVAASAQRRGVGKVLLPALCDAARASGFREMIAVIGDGSGNIASRRLHAACGFVDAGLLTNVGRKFGRWLDVAYMQKSL
jgi:phosphinothricin acetyltransferase